MRRHAFTLVELLVALTVLLVVIIATARIFGTTSKVAAIGEASADLQATATAVEKIIRADIERIARDGVLAIQCVAVRNDVNRYQRGVTSDITGATFTSVSSTAPLLDPTRATTDFVRCDQIVFFGRGHEVSQVYLGTQGAGIPAYRKGDEYALNLFGGSTMQVTPEITSKEFMIRLGHGLQFPSLLVDVNNEKLRPDADTLGSSVATVIPPVPWMWSTTPTMTASNFDTTTVNSTKYMPGQPEARNWVLARQVILLADDGNTQLTTTNTYETSTAKNLTWFHNLGGGNMIANSATGIAQLGQLPAGSAPTTGQKEATLIIPHDNMFPNRAITASRVDTAATSIAEYRKFVETGSTSANLAKDFNFDSKSRLFWSDQEGADPSGTMKLGSIRNRIFNSLFGGNVAGRTNGMWGYPRAEKVAPSMDRTDSKVSIPLLAGNCSSIQIDWTWSNGAAEFQTADGTPLLATLPATLNTSPLLRPVPISNIPLAGLTMVNWPVQPLFMPTAASPSGAFPITSGVAAKIPWFGLPDSIFPMAQRRGVTMLGGALPNSKAAPLQLAQSGTVPPDPRAASYATPIQILKPTVATDPKKIIPFTALDVDTIAIATPPIDCARIEGSNGIGFPLDVVQPAAKYSVYTYQAIFGPNGDKPYSEARYPGGSERLLRTDYTPWPTALRFTITLHDPKLALSQGRVFQFVVELPKADKE